MSASTTLRIRAGRDQIADIREFVRARAAAFGVAADILNAVILAIDEAATNVIVHGYQAREGILEIVVECDARDLILRLRDEAPPFDPTLVPSPDLSAPLSERPLGGVGVHLMRQTMDGIVHRLTEQGGNELILIKRDVIPPKET